MVIVTDHLALREFEEDDFEAILSYQSDPRYLRFYERTWAENQSDNVRELLERFLSWQHEEPRTKVQLAVTLRENGRLIGNVGLRMKSPGSTEGDIGCEIAPDYWNRGCATEATHAMLTFGFEQLGLHRISASTMAGNSGARHVLEKLGMTLEGELRETTLLASGWANSVIYAILEREWYLPVSKE